MIRVLSGSFKIVLIIALTVGTAAGAVWFFNYWMSEQEPDNVGWPVSITIAEGEETSTVAENLHDAHLINNTTYFETRMRLSGVELRPGTYTLRIGMSVPDIIDIITVPQVAQEGDATQTAGPRQPAFTVTFIEGQRIEQNAQVLQDAGMPDAAAQYTALAQDVDRWRDAYSFLADVPAGGTLEGFLFPSTYNIPDNATPADVIDLQLATFGMQWTDAMQQQLRDRDLTVFQAVTLASLVEREAALPEERPMVAEVYENRLDQGIALGADPAQQYGVGTSEDWWPQLNTELLAASKTTPYDTYDHIGLPPGPIANPGIASIQGVLQPSQEGYLYFVTRGDDSGAHVFTHTLEEHNAATCEQHPDWEACQAN